VQDVVQHDGTVLRLRKLHADYDAGDRSAAVTYLQQRREAGEIVTGLLYVRPDADDLHRLLNTVDVPLNGLGEQELIPGAAALEKFNASLR
jgi:2-oxoglutarate/2-oxoacid ferredoxin oxidoreductase subunit beta